MFIDDALYSNLIDLVEIVGQVFILESETMDFLSHVSLNHGLKVQWWSEEQDP